MNFTILASVLLTVLGLGMAIAGEGPGFLIACVFGWILVAVGKARASKQEAKLLNFRREFADTDHIVQQEVTDFIRRYDRGEPRRGKVLRSTVAAIASNLNHISDVRIETGIPLDLSFQKINASNHRRREKFFYARRKCWINTTERCDLVQIEGLLWIARNKFDLVNLAYGFVTVFRLLFVVLLKSLSSRESKAVSTISSVGFDDTKDILNRRFHWLYHNYKYRKYGGYVVPLQRIKSIKLAIDPQNFLIASLRIDYVNEHNKTQRLSFFIEDQLRELCAPLLGALAYLGHNPYKIERLFRAIVWHWSVASTLFRQNHLSVFDWTNNNAFLEAVFPMSEKMKTTKR